MPENTASTSSMKVVIRVAKYLKPFIGLFVLLITVNALFSIFSAMSIAIIKPVFQLIFDDGLPKEVNMIPNTSLEGMMQYFYSLLKQFIYIEGNPAATLLNLSGFVIATFLFKNIFKYWGSVLKIKFDEGVLKSIRDKVFEKITSLSVDFFSKNREGSLISIATNDTNLISTSFLTTLTDFMREIVQIIIYIILLLAISPYLTFIAFCTSIISLIIIRFSIKYLRRYATRMQNAIADYTSLLHETIFGIRIIKAYNAEPRTLKSFKKQTGLFLKSSVKYTKIISLVPSVNELLAIVALCVVFYIGGLNVLSGVMKADDLMLFLFTVFAIMAPITTTINSISQFQRGFVGAERVFNILDENPSVQSGSKIIDDFNNSFVINNVSFNYNDSKSNKEVIKNVSFELKKTKRVAFVGASGSGKSTMLDLIIRFYDPKSGEITIDGINIKELKIDSYRSMFGIVSQEPILFNDSIANNIRFGYEEATIEEIIEAAKFANAHNFIANLPETYDTYIGDRGVKLSGGERQRIAIARALLRNPSILVFDEATSSLDAESEKTVQIAINQSLKNRTAIIVAHRLATIIDCDEILVFDKGRIVERGSHHELYNHNGIYRKLYNIQFASAE